MSDSEKAVVWHEAGDAMIDVKTVADMCNVSTWHIYKMARNGVMPPPIYIGKLLRWKRRTIALWIKAGCPKPATNSGKNRG